MRKEDVELLAPGVKVQVGSRLLGGELYGWEDPDILDTFLGEAVTIKKIERAPTEDTWFIYIEQSGSDDPFIIEEIECLLPDQELEESDRSINDLLGI